MRHLSYFFVLILCGLLPFSLLANGGPVDGSSFASTGNIRILPENRIELLSENLSLKVEGDQVTGHVEYSLRNLTQNKVNVQYGFPIYTDINSEMDFGFSMGNKNSISMKLENQPLVVVADTDIVTLREPGKSEYGGQKLHWFLAEIEFPAGQTTTLSVEFSVTASYEDWATSKSPLVHFSPRKFQYLFTPALGWANAEKAPVQLTVDATQSHADDGIRFLKMPDVAVQSSDTAGGTYRFESFRLGQADSLMMEWSLKRFKERNQFDSGLLKPGFIQSATCDYEPFKDSLRFLFDNDPTTVLHNPNTGKDVTITLTFLPGTEVNLLSLIPGDVRDPSSWPSQDPMSGLNIYLRYHPDYYGPGKMEEDEIGSWYRIPKWKVWIPGPGYEYATDFWRHGEILAELETMKITFKAKEDENSPAIQSIGEIYFFRIP